MPLMRQRWSGWQRGKKKYVFIGDIYEILWNTCQMDVRSSSFVSNSRPTRHWRLKRKEPIRLSSHHPFPAAPFDDVDDNESTSDSTRLSKEPSHLVINVAMSLHLSEAEANEKSLSQVYSSSTSFLLSWILQGKKLITSPCETVINNPEARPFRDLSVVMNWFLRWCDVLLIVRQPDRDRPCK